ncbi:hypothetical protein BD560DRAFT_321151 [Blakeslea trispora]|nr:hypothetical protein BD560DRAFT_321151 [Blakeslea trispora]
MGGLSHMAWALEIGQVLAERGHNVSFLTKEPFLKIGEGYAPSIKTISLGPHNSKVQFRDLFDTEDSLSPKIFQAYKQIVEDLYIDEFMTYKDIYKSSNTSIAICDQMTLACVDAARALNLPSIVYMTMSLSDAFFFTIDTRAPFINTNQLISQPTTLDLSFAERLYNRYILTPKQIYRYLPVTKAIQKARKALNIEDIESFGEHSNTIKMINGFWGMESPRPVGPLVEYVGPIINTAYDPLNDKLSRFMDSHERVVYIAFGQMYNPSKEEFKVLLTSLVEAYESDYLNGFIWSLSMKSRHNLPEQIITRSGKVYKVRDLLQNHADLRFETWSPQFAILQHSHCKLFISHGGASSIHESLYNGVPLLLHPFTSDQPKNANNIVASGVALQVDRKKHNVTDTFEKLSNLLLDKDGKFANNMKSMQALVQIRSRRKTYAADMIEEVLYSVRDGSDLWYRRQMNERMPWYKATNLDINIFSVGIIAFLFSNVYAVIRFVFVSHKKHKIE